jgi:F-type H+-transporting ATPase subunit b
MAEEATHGAACRPERSDAAHGGARHAAARFSTFPNQIFWLVVTLVAIYFILSQGRAAADRVGVWPNGRGR